MVVKWELTTLMWRYIYDDVNKKHNKNVCVAFVPASKKKKALFVNGHEKNVIRYTGSEKIPFFSLIFEFLCKIRIFSLLALFCQY
jgi:hypothetical protein